MRSPVRDPAEHHRRRSELLDIIAVDAFSPRRRPSLTVAASAAAMAICLAGTTIAVAAVRDHPAPERTSTASQPATPRPTSSTPTSTPDPFNRIIPAPPAQPLSSARTEALLEKCIKPDPANHEEGWTEATRPYTGFRFRDGARWRNVLVGQFTSGDLRGAYIMCDPNGAEVFGQASRKDHPYLFWPIDGWRYAAAVAAITVQRSGETTERAAVMQDGIWWADTSSRLRVTTAPDGSAIVDIPDEGPRVRAYDATGKLLYDSNTLANLYHGCYATPDGKTLLYDYESQPPTSLSTCHRAYAWPPKS
jgi:hypothetical protein